MRLLASESRKAISAAISSGSSRPADGGRVGVDERSEHRVRPQLLGHRGGDDAGGHGVEPDALPDPGIGHALAPRPPGQRGLRRRVDHHRVDLTCVRAGRLLVVGQAEVGHRRAPARHGGDRVGGEQDDTGASGRRQPCLEAADEGHGPEEVHRDHQGGVDAGGSGDARARHQSVHDVGQLLDSRHRGRPAGGRGQVGDHVGVVEVDGDHPVTLVAQQRGGGGADPAGGTTDDERLHPSRSLTSPAKVAM